MQLRLFGDSHWSILVDDQASQLSQSCMSWENIKNTCTIGTSSNTYYSDTTDSINCNIERDIDIDINTMNDLDYSHCICESNVITPRDYSIPIALQSNNVNSIKSPHGMSNTNSISPRNTKSIGQLSFISQQCESTSASVASPLASDLVASNCNSVSNNSNDNLKNCNNNINNSSDNNGNNKHLLRSFNANSTLNLYSPYHTNSNIPCWSHIPSMEGDTLREYITNHLGLLSGIERHNTLVNGFIHNQTVLKNRNPPWLIYLAGPSGGGKSYAREHFFEGAFEEEFYNCVKVFPDFIRPMLPNYNKLISKVNDCGCKQHLSPKKQTTQNENDNENNYTYFDLLNELGKELIEMSHEIMFKSMKYNCHISREASLKNDGWFHGEILKTKKQFKNYKIALFYVIPKTKQLLINQLTNRNNCQQRQVLIDSAIQMYDGCLQYFDNPYLNNADIVVKALNPGIDGKDKDWIFEIYINGKLKRQINGEMFVNQFHQKGVKLKDLLIL